MDSGDGLPSSWGIMTADECIRDCQSAETAVILLGATIVDQFITIALASDYTQKALLKLQRINKKSGGIAEAAGQKAEDVVSMQHVGQTSYWEKMQLIKPKSSMKSLQFTSTAAAKAATVDQKIGRIEKISIGTTLVNEKVKDLDQKFQVSEKTKTSFATTEKTVSEAGSAIVKNRYVLTGTSWVAQAFSRVTKAVEEVGQKTMENVAEGEQSGKTESTRQEPPTSPKATNS